MKSLHGNSLAVAATALLLAGCAGESLGPEYGEVSEEESSLQFYAPGLAGGYRKFISGQDELYINRMVGVYGPKQGNFPHGQLILIEMPPGRHFTRINPPRDTIDEWGPFENRKITHGPAGTAVNAIGRIDYAAFLADNLSCIVFRQPFGTVHDTGRGTRLLDGYYCKGEAPIMTKGEAVAIVNAVGHSKYGPIKPPEGWSVTEKPMAAKRQFDLTVVWAGADGTKRLTGTAYIGDENQPTELRIYKGTSGSCHGVMAPDTATGNSKEGSWELRCGDGSKASGRYMATGDSMMGSGKDADANDVSLRVLVE